MTTLLQILAATLLSSILSIVLAGLISFKFLDRYMSKMLCISAGLLLTVAFTHLLPEAFEIHENAVSVGWTLLVSVLFLFCLEFALSHQHHGHVNPPEHTISEYIKGSQKRSSGAGNAILIGDAFHNFTDGILIASAFMVSSGLGWVTALAILAHEIPQEVGDFMVLLHSGFERSKALLWNVISGLTSMLGGIAGYFLLDRVEWMVPYAFAIAAASFIYIALSDLMPEIAHQEKPERFYVQLFFILIGVAMAVLATGGLHEHGSEAVIRRKKAALNHYFDSERL